VHIATHILFITNFACEVEKRTSTKKDVLDKFIELVPQQQSLKVIHSYLTFECTYHINV
jgi:hypothetical protein